VATLTETRPLPQFRTLSFRLPILDRYLLKEIFWPFVFAFIAFLIFWALNIFFIAADYEIKGAPFFLVLTFVLFRMPQSVPMAFPFASLFSTLWAISRLSSDNEITAMRTSGIPLWRFSLTPLIFGLAMFGCAYFINEYVSTASTAVSTQAFYQIVYHTESLPVEPQFFRKDPDTGNVFYVTSVAPDDKTMQDVQIFRPGLNGYWRETLQAKTATIVGSNMVLHDVVMTTYNAAGMVTAQGPVKTWNIGLPMQETAAQFMSSVNNDPWTMSSKTLAAQVKTLQTQGMGGPTIGNLEVSLASKLAWPFASFIAVLLALTLAVRFGRRGRAIGAAMAIVAFFVYFLLWSALTALGRNGIMDPFFAAWLPNIIMGGLGAFLFWAEEH
jgi:lipopolysaccharide export system permease protein